MNENLTVSPSITINVPNNSTGVSSVTVLDLSWYTPYKQYGDMVITAFVYLFFIIRLWRRVPAIINGVTVEGGNSQ